jgi:hypothetical protein
MVLRLDRSRDESRGFPRSRALVRVKWSRGFSRSRGVANQVRHITRTRRCGFLRVRVWVFPQVLGITQVDMKIQVLLLLNTKAG